MWKWLRSWFSWRFSLRRLVVAVVFLGAFVGLNVCGPQTHVGGSAVVVSFWGWPLPARGKSEGTDVLTPSDLVEFDALRWVPWTHCTYHLTKHRSVRWVRYGKRELCGYGPINALVGIIPLLLILFLHPRRKPPDECPT